MVTRLIVSAFVLMFSTNGFAEDPGTLKVGFSGTGVYGHLPMGGFDLGLNFGPMFMVGVAFYGGTANFESIIEDEVDDKYPSYDYTIEEASLSRSLAALTLNFFPFAGSFNIGANVGSSTTVIDLEVTSGESSEAIEEKRTYNNTTAAITFGNMWRWNHFYFGFDWLGYYAVLSSSKDEESSTTSLSAAAMTKAMDKFDDFSDQIGEQGGPILLTIKIGTGF